MGDPNQRLFDLHLAHAIDAQRAAENERDKTAYLLLLLFLELRDLVLKADLPGYARPYYKQKAQERLIDAAAATIAAAYGSLRIALLADLYATAAAEQVFQVNALNRVFQAEVIGAKLSADELRKIVKAANVQGAPLKDWLDKQAADLSHRAAAEVRLGNAANENSAELAVRLIGNKTGAETTLPDFEEKRHAVPVYAGGLLPGAARDAGSIVRSAVQTAVHAAAGEVQAGAAGAGLLRGFRWCSILDGRTSDICKRLSDACWDFEFKPLAGSRNKRPWEGPPPRHPNCRSTIIPLVGSWKHLVRRAGGNIVGALKFIPPLVQESLTGSISPAMTFVDWFRRKTEDEQREILGDARYRLWKRGKLKDGELAEWSGNVISLKEFARRCAELGGGA